MKIQTLVLTFLCLVALLGLTPAVAQPNFQFNDNIGDTPWNSQFSYSHGMMDGLVTTDQNVGYTVSTHDNYFYVTIHHTASGRIQADRNAYDSQIDILGADGSRGTGMTISNYIALETVNGINLPEPVYLDYYAQATFFRLNMWEHGLDWFDGSLVLAVDSRSGLEPVNNWYEFETFSTEPGGVEQFLYQADSMWRGVLPPEGLRPIPTPGAVGTLCAGLGLVAFKRRRR